MDPLTRSTLQNPSLDPQSVSNDPAVCKAPTAVQPEPGKAGVEVTPYLPSLAPPGPEWAPPPQTSEAGFSVADALYGGRRESGRPQVCSNFYELKEDGRTPEAAGSVTEQVNQAAHTLKWSGAATARQVSPDFPSDQHARDMLAKLNPSPPLASEPEATATTRYQSVVQGKSAQDAYQAFVNDPAGVFGSAGIKLVPPVERLTDGARLFLEEPAALGSGRPPVWAPIEVRLDPKENTVRITTLEGHPLRGTNEFKFVKDPDGARIEQESRFQGSSAPTLLVGLKVGNAIERQHEIWQNVHSHLARTDQ